MRAHAIRLPPGSDLIGGIDHWCRSHGIAAATVLSGIGSVRAARIRFAGREEVGELPGPLEILFLQGTVSPDGCHLHVGVSDPDGCVTGGHLKPGTPVATTAEIVIAELPGWRFHRVLDPRTGCLELEARRHASPPVSDDDAPQ